MNIAYITVSAPYGIGEKFILDEIESIEKINNRVIVFPVRPAKKIIHMKGESVTAIRMELFSCRIAIYLLKYIFTHPLLYIKMIYKIIAESHSLSNIVKNLIVLPKGIYIAQYMKKMDIDHIHAHWETTTSTIGYLCHLISNIPWSFSAHSGQILWDNMICEKIKTVSFCRVISQSRKKDILALTNGAYADKIHVIHMGVALPIETTLKKMEHNTTEKMFRIVCVASLDKIKGHKFLLSAIRMLTIEFPHVMCDIIGSGEEYLNLKNICKELGIQSYVNFLGALPNERILQTYKQGIYDVFVLPSIKIQEERREEGIPVALMEAMSYGVPVISTMTGSINELIEDGVSGFLVEDKDPNALFNALKQLLQNESLRYTFAEKALLKVQQDFEVNLIAAELCKLMENN